MENRIKLNEGFRIRLFNRILSENKSSLKQLAKKLGCGYSGLKNWRRGDRLIPENVFNRLLDLANFKLEEVKNDFSIEPPNWGAQLGGLNSNNKPKKFIIKKMAHARKFRKNLITLPKVNNEVWELLGAFLGDGCLSRTFSTYDDRWLYLCVLTGHMYDDEEYYRERIIPIIRTFGCKADYHLHPKDTSIRLRVNSKKVFYYLRSLGMPIGEKIGKLKFTNRIFKSPRKVKAAILRGLFDTDGHIFARKDEDYKYLHIEITSADKIFRKHIRYLIEDFGLHPYEHDTNVLIRGNNNVRTWMELIGSSHPIHMKRYNLWLQTGRLLSKRALGATR